MVKLNMLLTYILVSAILLNMTWIYFCAIMRLQQVRSEGELVGVMKWIAYPNLVIGLLLDTLLNWLVMSVLFLEFPHEFLTTARLCRWYEKAPLTWRGRIAAGLGRALLNPIDPSGKHVK